MKASNKKFYNSNFKLTLQNAAKKLKEDIKK